MLVCLCHGVNDRKVREVIADGAACLRDIASACGAGSDCGSCRPMLRKMLQDQNGADVYSLLPAARSALPASEATLGGVGEGPQGSHRAA